MTIQYAACRCRDCEEVADALGVDEGEIATMCSGCNAAGCLDRSDTSTSGDCRQKHATVKLSADEIALARRVIADGVKDAYRQLNDLRTRELRGEAVEAARDSWQHSLNRLEALSRKLWRVQ